jgi:SPP1 gp7 family putative phage head morphogenesis protein
MGSLPFTEAIAYLRDRLAISDTDWQALLQAADETARRIVDDTVSSMRKDLMTAINAIFEAGGTVKDFQAQYETITERHGWATDAGKPGWHSELVWRMEAFGARAAGRWEQAQRLNRAAPHLGYCFRYVTAGDHRVRDSHAKMHGIILPVDHPYWHTHFPPNGFNCRCLPTIVSRRDLVRYGWTITPDSDPRLSVPPDPGFENNVGMAWQSLRA